MPSCLSNYDKNLLPLVLPCLLFVFISVTANFMVKNLGFLNKTEPVLLQEKFEKFPVFDLSKCSKINSSDTAFPYVRTVFFDHHIDDNKTPLVYTGNNWGKRFIETYAATFYIEAVNIYYIRNGFVGNYRLIVSNYTNFIDVTNTSFEIKERYAAYNTTEGYRYVITAVTDWGRIYAHMFTDVFGPLLFVEEDIWKLKPILCLHSAIPDLVYQYLDIMGHSDIQLKVLNNEVIYAENLFAVSGYSPLATSGFYSMDKLRKLVYNYYQLHNNKQINYGYMNRNGTTRHFSNMDELISIFEQQHGISFIYLKANQPSRESFAKIMS